MSTSKDVVSTTKHNFVRTTSNCSNSHKETSQEADFGESGPWEQESTLAMTNHNKHSRGVLQSSVDGCLQKICLRPKYSLRHQLFVSFGLVSILALSFVVVTAVITAIQAGTKVKDISRTNLQDWAQAKLQLKSRYLAETVDQKLQNYESMMRIISEVTRDRFAGYPAADDSSVPFPDSISGKNVYPLVGSLIPLDWQFEQFPTDEGDDEELMRGRFSSWEGTQFSTKSCGLKFQGACDPTEVNSNAAGFHPFCSDEHNDLSVGGLLQPTGGTFSTIHRKASDICDAVVRPFYEYHSDLKGIGLHFVNDGAGTSIEYPANRLDATQSYISAGCDWMRQPNPMMPSESVGTEDAIARCHAAGAKVPSREYNALERPWFSKQAMDPHQVRIAGPFENAWKNGAFVLLATKAIFDRITKQLIAVVVAELSPDSFADVISDAKIAESSEIALLRWSTGIVFVSDRWVKTTDGVIDVTKLGLGIDQKIFDGLKRTFEENYKENYNRDDTHITRFVNGRYISSSPVPIPPQIYDPDYEPQFMVISTITDEDVLAEVSHLESEVDEHVEGLIRDSLIAGLIGLVVVTSVIFVVSLYLTKPLEWMNEVGDQIIQDFGAASVKAAAGYQRSCWVRFSPRTEITDLVAQFQQMIQKFSGAGVAKLFRKQCVEMRNPFELKANFIHLYESRKRDSFKHRYCTTRDQSQEMPLIFSDEPRGGDDVEDRFDVVHHRLNWGHNGSTEGDVSTFVSIWQESFDDKREKNKLVHSRLFWWIVCSMTVPLLLGMIAISVLVGVQVSRTFPEITGSVQNIYVNLESASLLEFARLRASFAAEVMFAPIRDLFVATRVTEWLLFGALERADSYTSIKKAAEACKTSEKGACDFFANKTLAVCDCAWDDPWGEECYDYAVDTRSLQLQHFESQSDDAWANGDRNFTSFPDLATSPNTTSFWPDAQNLPGFEKGGAAGEYGTSYDRMRVLSATSMINTPLYNYGIGTRLNRNLGLYIGMEADGIFGGYAGCYHHHADYAHFQFNLNTSAEGVDPKLCPLGKYGFDPRCRGWYADGKRVDLRGGNPLHVTSPYIFAGVDLTGQSAAMSMIDPVTGEFVGETLIDFTTELIIQALTHERTPLLDGFHVLISPQPDKDGSGTIVAPGFDFGGFGGLETGSIGEFVVPNGEPETGKFEETMEDMRAGGAAQARVDRLTKSGGTETIYFAYAPVEVTSLESVDASDWNRGVRSYKSHIFSLAVGERAAGVLAAFDSIEEALQRTSNISLAVLSVLILLSFMSVLYLSARVTISIITPVTELLFLTTKINLSETNEELPIIAGGSSEVSRVHQTFERLHMVVRFANTAFFSGDLTKAYTNLIDALALFTKLENSKAIGITNNNLGNTMLTIYRTMKKTGAPTMCGLSKSQIVAKGVAYFDATIDIGEKALSRINEEEGWSTNYLVFMQQLSNRYFNRAMFMLSVIDDHPSPADAEQKGCTDLATAKDMDREVIDNGDQHGFKGEVDVHFDLLLGRVKGILLLLEMGYDDKWDVEELLVEASSVLNGAFLSSTSNLFRDLAPAAQMQRLDAAWITFYMTTHHKNVKEAATIAIRMLRDDEYVICDAGVKALKALIDYVADTTADDLGGEDPSNVCAALFQCRRQIVEAISLSRHGKDLSSMESMRQCNQGDLSMEIF